MSGSILEFTKDLSEQEAPAPLPKGPYRGEIIGAQWRTSSTTGNEYAQITIRIPESEYPADFVDGDPDGTVLTYNRLQKSTTPTAAYRWRQFMEKVGGPLGRSIDLNTILGLPVTVEVDHQEYEGEQRAQAARILAP